MIWDWHNVRRVGTIAASLAGFLMALTLTGDAAKQDSSSVYPWAVLTVLEAFGFFWAIKGHHEPEGEDE